MTDWSKKLQKYIFQEEIFQVLRPKFYNIIKLTRINKNYDILTE